MSLEKDINQIKFRTEHQKVIINIIYTYNWMNERLKSFFEKEDIRKLISSLNKACASETLSDERLERAFSVWYPNLEEQLNHLHQSNTETAIIKDKEEQVDTTGKILEEILDLTRNNQKLLRNPGIQINEVCYLSGFEDANYFIRLFKKHEGITPKQYQLLYIN